MDNIDYRRLLVEAAETVPPSGIDRSQLIRRIRQRRRRRYTRIGILTTSVAVMGSTVALWAVAHDGPDTDASGPKQKDVPGVTCGQPLGVAMPEGPSLANLRLTIDSVTRDGGGGPPHVTVSYRADAPVRAVETGQYMLQVLVLRAGIVVDKIGGAWLPENAPDGALGTWGRGASALVWPVSPEKPRTQVLSTSKWTSCPRVDWQEVWSNPRAYSVVAYVSMPTVEGATNDVSGTVPALLASKASDLTR